MTTDDFWKIVEETHDRSMAVGEEKLKARLCMLPEKEILAFDRIWGQFHRELYTSLLWGVAHLAKGWCSDDSFTDWRDWLISCGRGAFETGRDRPDDLVPLIDAESNAGCEGIGYAAMDALRAKNPKWKNAHPVSEQPSLPPELSGPPWKTEEDLKEFLPKTYARYVTNATKAESNMRDPDWVVEKFGAELGPAEEFRPHMEDVIIDGQKARKMTLIPVPKKKPWWKFWA
jgi:hypothetical protein